MSAAGRKLVHDKDRAFNVWLDILDTLLDRHLDLTRSMLTAGEQLQEEQQRSDGGMFQEADLWIATQEINLLLRRTQDYKPRTAGWSKESIQRKTYARDL